MENLIRAVDKNREIILNALDYIWKNPETGYKEFKTSKYLEDEFEKLGYSLVKAENIPGFYTVLDTGRPGPEVLVLGELDSLICETHPEADKETKAVHCCGHAAQAAALLGLAAALKEPGVTDNMCGKIRLCAVPAEELIEIEYRTQLKEKGIIKYLGGKTEFLYRGYFDGVDVAFMVHTSQGENMLARTGSIGCISKRIIYKGKSAHAGGAPWNGCNALYAANLGINAINAIRETFKEEDIIRVHPVITQGGSAVNAIPDTVVLESYVRGKTFEAIEKANKKVNRALIGAALSLGANVEIQDKPGYAPLVNSEGMIEMALEAGNILPDVPKERDYNTGSGCTDMGDLSGIMPAVHPYMPGATGTSHGNDYYINNPELACVGCAKWQLNMLNLLLKDGGKRAYEIKDNFKPTFNSKEEYFEYIDSFVLDGDRITYNENDAEVRM